MDLRKAEGAKFKQSQFKSIITKSTELINSVATSTQIEDGSTLQNQLGSRYKGFNGRNLS